MQISTIRLSVFVLSLAMVSTGCATKKYVRQQMGIVDSKVSQLASTVQENSERLDATDGRARQGLADAASARNAANAAQASANQANSAAAAAQSSADTANQIAQNNSTKNASLDSRLSTLEDTRDRYTPGPVTTVNFKTGRSDLSKEAQQALDEIVAPIAGLDRDYRVEIQGYASAEGAETKNINLSQERSEAVQRYLASKGADVIRMQVIGLGTQNPVGDNKTTSGRQQNRRAEIRVFSAAK